MEPIKIQKTIDEAITQEFENLLKNNKNDKLLKILVKLNEKNQSIEEIDLDDLIHKLA
jgi:hypothetical protein